MIQILRSKLSLASLLVCVAGFSAQAAPVISNAQVAGTTTVTATVTWLTDVPASSQVVFVDGSVDATPTGRTPEDKTLVNTHVAVVPNLTPNTNYFVYVVSRAADGTVSSTFPNFLNFQTGAIDTTAPEDYVLRTHGSKTVHAGSDLYFNLHSTLLAGQSNHLYYDSVSGLPPSISLHFICRSYMPTINEDNDCLQDYATGRYYSWNGADMDHSSEEAVVRLRTTAQTTPGTYSVTIQTSSGGVSHSLVYTFNVVATAVPVVKQSAVTAPPVPGLRNWETSMTTLGNQWCDTSQIFSFGTESQVWYYDGGRVYQQLADYTGNSHWLDCARNILFQYRDNILSRGGSMQGWRVFTQGLTMNYLRTADSGSRDAVISMAQNSAYASSSGGNDVNLIRETAYIVETYVKQQQLTGVVNPHLAKAVDYLLGDFDVIFRSDPNAYQQSFFDGLAAEALIQYYEVSSDPRVPVAIKTMLDFIWTNCWDQNTHMLLYSPLATPGAYETVSNNLVAPAFAWYWNVTGDTTYLTRGDELFVHALDQDITYSGKIFSQNYHWSFDYLRWRSGGRYSETNPAANTGTIVREVPLPTGTPKTATTADITWSTNIASTGQVEYGLSTAYELSSPITLAQTLAHTISLAGLQSDTLYHYRVRGVDAAGNLKLSGDATFRTPPVPYQSADGTWYNRSWAYRKQFVIDHTKVSSTLQSYPLLISIPAGDTASVTFGGHVAKADGSDILFTAPDGTLLNFDLERYVPQTGEITAWVRIPTVSSTADTAILMYYGNDKPPTSAAASGTWDTGYHGVWHLSTSPATTSLLSSGTDATASFNTASVVSVTSIPGAVGMGAGFSAEVMPMYMTAPASADVTGTALTVEAWVNPLITNPGVVVSTLNPDLRKGFELQISNDLETDTPFQIKVGDSTNLYCVESLTMLPRNAWSHIVAVLNGGNVALYLNGSTVPVHTTGTPVNHVDASGLNLNIGRSPFFTQFSAYYIWGGLDEIRVSATARSASWIAAEYKNQSAPTTFSRMGSTQAAPKQGK